LTIIANVGFRKDNLKVSLEKDLLVVHGERDSDHEPVDDAGHCPSRRRIPLSFTRYIPLPSYVDKTSISAVYHKYKLHVYLSKKLELQQNVRFSLPPNATPNTTSSIAPRQSTPIPYTHAPIDTSDVMEHQQEESTAPSSVSNARFIGFDEVNDFNDPLAVSASHDIHINCDHTRHICHTASQHTNQSK